MLAAGLLIAVGYGRPDLKKIWLFRLADIDRAGKTAIKLPESIPAICRSNNLPITNGASGDFLKIFFRFRLRNTSHYPNYRPRF